MDAKHFNAGIAQLGEQRTCNAQVGSSILSVASKYLKNKLHQFQNFCIFLISSRIVDNVGVWFIPGHPQQC